jgi:hypothetical protein
MIRETELRIGNLLNHNDGIMVGSFIVGLIHLEDIIKDNSHAREYEPILLTEEWLLKFGFENRPDGICDHWHLGINPITHDWMIELKSLGAGFFYRNGYFNIKYVHTLQNLYFALTNQELEIKK